MLHDRRRATPVRAPASGFAEPVTHQPAEMVDDLSFPSRVLEPRRPTLVLFTAEGCLPCEFLARRLPALVPEVDGPVDVVRCPIETSPLTSRRYKVSCTPTLLLFKDGLRIASHVGPAPIPVIRRWVADSLARRSNIRVAEACPTIGGDPSPPLARMLIRHAFSRPIALRASRTAGVVAIGLLLLNNLGVRSGSPDGYSAVARLAVDFLIAYLVSSYSSVRTAIAGGSAATPGAGP